MDELILEHIGIEISKIKNMYNDCNKNLSGDDDSIFSTWQYPIEKKFPVQYDVKTAQSLLEIIQYISWLNGFYTKDKTVVNNFLYPTNFDICIRVSYPNSIESNMFFFLYSTTLNMAIIVFSGTYDETMAFINMNIKQENFYTNSNDYAKKHVRLHAGYNQWYNSCKKTLYFLLNKYTNKNTQIIPCGISLGGAVACICSLDLQENGYQNQLLHYSFASPRVWNIHGAQHYNNYHIPAYRIYNSYDMVPKLPLNITPNILDPFMLESNKLLLYVHVSNGIAFNYDLGSIIRNHGESYIKYFQIKTKSCVIGDDVGGY